MRAPQRVRYYVDNAESASATAAAPVPVVHVETETMKPTQPNETAQPIPVRDLPATLAAGPQLVSSRSWTVLDALRDGRYDWRSANGISQETKIPMHEVIAILENDLGDAVVRSFDQDYPDRYFYTTRDHYKQIRGTWHQFLSVICDEIR